jgi:hypothetical protein
VHSSSTRTTADSVRSIRRRILDDGLYRGPARKWSPERDHRAITAMFEDRTYGGFDPNLAFDSRFENGRWVVPTFASGVAPGGASIVTEGRRYFDETVMLRVARLPDVSRRPPAETTPATVQVSFWADSRERGFWGMAPQVRFHAWAGRGWVDPQNPQPPAIGQAGHSVEVWDVTPQGFARLARADVPWVPLGAEFVLRVAVEAGGVRCAVDGVEAFAQPVRLVSAPPADGGMTQVQLLAGVRDDRFELDWILVRPSAGNAVIPDVHVDHAGDVWFSLVCNGDLAQDLFGGGGGAAQHFVDVTLAPRPGIPSGGPLRVAFPQWLGIALAHETHGIGRDHWVYGLRGVAWETGDQLVLEYRGAREGEQVPPR